MKCDRCGKEEVNFHYTSNINGNITEKHLCAQCAGELGISGLTGFPGYFGGMPYTGLMGRRPVTPDSSFEEIFADLFGMRPLRKMLGGFGMMFPTFVIPTMGLVMPGTAPGTNPGPETGDGAVGPERADLKAEVDEEMKKRREINILREQMQQAVKSEDYEKAAVLRDKIRELEGGEGA